MTTEAVIEKLKYLVTGKLTHSLVEAMLDEYAKEDFNLSQIEVMLVASKQKTYQSLKLHKYISERLSLKKQEYEEAFRESDSIKERDSIQKMLDVIVNYNPRFTPFLTKYPITSDSDKLMSKEYGFLNRLIDSIELRRDYDKDEKIEIDQIKSFGGAKSCDTFGIHMAMITVMFGEGVLVSEFSYPVHDMDSISGYMCGQEVVSYQDLEDIRLLYLPKLLREILADALSKHTSNYKK